MVTSCGSKETKAKVTQIMASTPEEICKMIKSAAPGAAAAAANKVPIGLTILSESPEIAHVIMMILGAPMTQKQLEEGGMKKALRTIASGRVNIQSG